MCSYLSDLIFMYLVISKIELFIVNQVYGEDHRHPKSTEFSLFDTGFLTFYIPVVSCDSRYIGLIAYSFYLFVYYHVWLFICYITVLSCHYSDYISCSGYFRLSVYAWDIFVTYIHHRLLSRSVFTYFGKRGVTRFSWYQSQVRHKERT